MPAMTIAATANGARTSSARRDISRLPPRSRRELSCSQARSQDTDLENGQRLSAAARAYRLVIVNSARTCTLPYLPADLGPMPGKT
jgi:hypothetical protein